MRILLPSFLLCCTMCNVFAQQNKIQKAGNALHISKLPAYGLLLDSCWKFSASDNIIYASPGFDDSQWMNLNPAKDAKEFEQLLGHRIGWLRLHFIPDSTITKQPLVLQIQQNAASEIYVDGKLLAQYGTLSNNISEVNGFNPLNQPLPLSFNFDTGHVIAVRICLPDKISPFQYLRISNDFFTALLGDRTQYQQLENNSFYNSFSASVLKVGIFIIVLILHFSFYFFYRKEKVNLWLGVFDLFIAIGYALYGLLVFKIHDVELSYILRIPASLFFTIGSWFLLLATYNGFRLQKGFMYQLFLALMFAIIIIYFTPLNNILSGFASPQTFWYPVLVNAESIRLSLTKLRTKNRVINPLSPVMVFCVLSVTAAIISLHIKSFGSGNLNYIFGSLINIALLGLPISFFMYVAIEFKFYYTNLVRAQALRNKIALDLHDDLGTKLSTARMFLKSHKDNKQVNNELLLDNSIALLDTSINDLRHIMDELHQASTLIEKGYVAATEELVNKINGLNQINFVLNHNGLEKRMEQKTEYNLYRITQELINNTLKYADAKNVSIDIVNRDDKIIFMYEDDGVGHNMEIKSKGFGLSNILSRSESLGGKVEFDSSIGAGFRTIIELPLVYA